MMKICHFDCRYGRFASFIAELASGSFLSLLEGVDGDYAENKGRFTSGVDDGCAFRRLLANVIEMRRVAANYASYCNYCIGVAAHQSGRSVNEFYRARHFVQVYVIRIYARFKERFDSSVAQSVCDIGIPFGRNDLTRKLVGVINGGHDQFLTVGI